MSPKKSLMTAREAAAALGVKLPTLYAYVSRGLLHSRQGEGSRSRLYLRQEVEALRRRRERRRDPRQATAGALDWGLPVLDSGVTLIADGRLYYRGRDACDLARRATLEEVAALLWTGSEERAGEIFPEPAPVLTAPWRGVLAELADRHPGERLQIVLRFAATRDAAAMD
ncbi:MAG: citrate synthase, partial [Thermoanaerobaculia bacterium]|nr:citrate synthase [Thermoanaerobaculia bacterium]